MASDGYDLVGFDAEQAIETAREITDDAVLATGIYTPDDYEMCYISETIAERYDDEDAIDELAALIQQYGQIDFVERDTFPDMYPTLDAAYAFATFAGFATIVRVVGDNEAFYVSFEAGTDISPVVDELRAVVGQRD